jgi:hypothetical protein
VDPVADPQVIEHEGNHEAREHSPSVEIDVQGCVARKYQLHVDIRLVAQEA